MRIRWTRGAAADLEQIHDYLTQKHAHLAHSTVLRIHEAIQSLGTFPNRGRKGRREGTRELLVSPLPYIVVYRVRSEAVEILYIDHGARRPRQA